MKIQNLTKKTVNTLEKLISKNKNRDVRNLLVKLHPADIADLLQFFSEDDQTFIFKQFDLDTAGAILDEVEDTIQKNLIEDSNPYFIAAILERLFADQGADILGTISSEKANHILDLMHSEEAKDIKELMFYDPDTAGRIMSLDYLKIREDKTANDAMELIRKNQEEVEEEAAYIFVVNSIGKLCGKVSFRKLIIAAPTALISSLLEDNSDKSVTTDTDQAEVTQIMRKYDIGELPVVTSENVLKGIVTFDDIMEIARDENDEDFYRLSGSAEKDPITNSILKKVSLRTPWLAVTIIGGFLCSYIMKVYEFSLTEVVAVAFFSPLIMGLSGNVAIQSSTIIVRGLAIGEINPSSSLNTVFRELFSGMLTGLIVGIITGLVGIGFQDAQFGLILFVSMFLSILTGSIYGTFIPVICEKINIDPALAAGPFVLILTDGTALLIYLAIATKFLIH